MSLLFIIVLLLMVLGFTAGIYSSLQKISATLQALLVEVQRRDGRLEE